MTTPTCHAHEPLGLQFFAKTLLPGECSAFCLPLGCSKEEEGLCCVRSFAKVGWKLWHSGGGLWGSRNGLWLANRYWPSKGHCSLLQKVLQSFHWRLKDFHLQEGSSRKEELLGYMFGGWRIFTFRRLAAEKKNFLDTWEALLNWGTSCDVQERALSQIIWSAGVTGPKDKYPWGLWFLWPQPL